MAPSNKKEIITKIEEAILSRNGQDKGDEIYFLCPTHDDHNPSARWNSQKQAWFCDVCGVGGGYVDLASNLGIFTKSPHELVDMQCNPAFQGEEQNKNNEIDSAQVPADNCSLANYAKHKGLSVEFLTELGLADCKMGIKIPYYDLHGQEVAVRFRTHLQGPNRFKWKTGSKPKPYGLWKLHEAKKAGFVILVEGESDCHTLWHHNFPAFGLPGASNWKNDWEDYFEGIKTIYVLIEPDQGGKTVLKWLEKAGIRDRVKLIYLRSCKDPSELYLLAPDCFIDTFNQVLERGTLWSEQQDKLNEAIKNEQWEICKDLAVKSDILKKFEVDLLSQGFVGETRTAKLIYLVITSRLFSRPVSLAIKGPSSGGKSYLAEKVMAFFPETAFHVLTAMSEKSLVYSEEPLSHRFLVLFEAAGLSSDMASYLIRSLLSEGKLRYETVEKNGDGLKSRLINKEGPTGLLTTTTAISLHPENETRLLSVNVLDTPEQTKEIMVSLAEDHGNETVNFREWHALQEWLYVSNAKVKIPYAKELAILIPPTALRLRRDFHHILILIRAHALLHQATRNKTPDGKVIATLDDYGVVKDLIGEIISQGVGVTVSDTLRETVEAVRELSASLDFGIEGVTIKALSDHLKLDPSAVNRRVKNAITRELLQNVAPPRKTKILKLGNPLPDSQQILPNSEELNQTMQECTVLQEVQLEGVNE